MPHTINPFSVWTHAVLSHHPCEHLQDFLPAYPAALDQADDPPKVGNHARIEPVLGQGLICLLWLRTRRGFLRLCPLLIQIPLLDSPGLCAVVGGAAFRGTTLAVLLSATKGTAEIFSTRIPGIGEEEDAAVLATLQTPPQFGLSLKHKAQDAVVRSGEGACLPVTVPVWGKLEESLKLYCKKARFSLTMVISFCMPSSYPLGTHVSRGRTRAFSSGDSPSNCQATRPKRPAVNVSSENYRPDRPVDNAIVAAARKEGKLRIRRDSTPAPEPRSCPSRSR